MSKNTGGAAFPYVHDIAPLPGMKRSIAVEEGMTLRDYFAAKALPSILMDPESSIQRHHPDDHISNGSEARVADMWAEQAYQIADAMIAARGRP